MVFENDNFTGGFTLGLEARGHVLPPPMFAQMFTFPAESGETNVGYDDPLFSLLWGPYLQGMMRF